MSDKAGVRREYTRHFHLDEGRLRKIADVLRTHGQKYGEDTFLRYYVEHENNSFYETRAIDEVLADDNVPDKAIRTLVIELQKTTPDPEETAKPESQITPLVFVAFRKFKDEKVLFSAAANNRDLVFLLSDDLDSQITRILRGKSFGLLLSRSIDLIFFWALSGVALFLTMWYFSRPKLPILSSASITAMTPDERSIEILTILSDKALSTPYIYPFIFVVMAISIAIVEIGPIARLMRRANGSVFYWGDMKVSYDRFQKGIHLVKWGILITFVVSLLSSVVAAFIVR